MERLSSPIASIKPAYDVVVIGSGYGGSITASRMARAGKKVCLLERGREILPGEYPNEFKESSAETQIDGPKLQTGKKTAMFDVRVNPDITVIKGCGLGGGSLINANVGIEPEANVFTDPCWPQALRDDLPTLQKAFATVNTMLKTTTYPEAQAAISAKTNSLKTAAQKAGLADHWKLTPIYVNFDIDGPNHVGVEQKPCNSCGDCCSGCNYSAKNTLIMNYLPDAHNHGAEIYTQVNVRYVEQQDKQWKVHYNLLPTGKEALDAPTAIVLADVVVLAGGTLGSSELLLRSKQNGLACSDMTGTHFTGNGDFLAFSYNADVRANAIGMGKHPPNANDPVGPGISSIIDLRDPNDSKQGMVIEEGSTPGMLGNVFYAMVSLASKLEGKPTNAGIPGWLRKRAREIDTSVKGVYHGAANSTLIYLVMSNDDDSGKMLLEDDRLRVAWPSAGKQPIFDKVNSQLQVLTQTLDGVYTKNPVWTKLFSSKLVTVHPLGGCIMGEDAAQGVINHKGQVFSGQSGNAVYEGLYVSDGSIVPRPLSINPSLTISALAERICIYMAQDRGWTFNYDF